MTTELKGQGSGDNTGRISYENRGECFFLPYTKDDVEGNVVLRTGDAVSFQIATNQRWVHRSACGYLAVSARSMNGPSIHLVVLTAESATMILLNLI